MDLFQKLPRIDFMRWRRVAVTGSAIALVIAIIALFVRGMNLGIDFTGGTLIEIGYQKPADLTEIRSDLENSGYGDAVVQHFGTSRDVLVRIAPREGLTSAQLSSEVLGVLRQNADNPAEMRRVEFVGPQVGNELREKGGMAMLFALAGIFIYVAFVRFEYRFAVGAIGALVHDVLFTLGVFSLFQVEFDLTVLAALLAVVGYSLNDTIVVFDRVRENFRRMRKGGPVDVVNQSLNQTLSRTLMTSGTTLLVLIALFVLGGELIHSFALALIVGIVVGTYSSIYVASAAALAMGVSKEDLMPPEKEGADVDSMP